MRDLFDNYPAIMHLYYVAKIKRIITAISDYAMRHLAAPALSLLLSAAILAAPVLSRASDLLTVRVGGASSWTIPDKNAADPKSRADRAVIEAFEKLHPDIRLVNSNGLQIQGPAAESNLLLQFAGGSAPDVVYVNFRSMQNYIQQGFLMPLNDRLDSRPDILKRVSPIIRKVIDVNGRYYALPYAQYVQALYYRKDLFQEAGLDPNRPPKTWEEFYSTCRRITNPKTGVWGFEWPGSADGTAYWWCNFLWQAGGEVTTLNDRGQWIAAFDSPQGIAALKFYKKLTAEPYTVNGVSTTATLPNAANYSSDRARGKVAMWFAYQSNVIANVADATSINPSLVGIAPMPAGPGGTANEINAAMWGISSQIRDPRVRDAAWEFITFMGSDDADRIRTRSYVEAGLGNLINPASLLKYGYAEEASSMSKEWLKTNTELFKHGHPEPYGANMQAVYNLVGQPLQAIVLNPNADPHTLLAQAAVQVNNKLIGYTSPKVLAKRRAIALAVFILLVLAAVTGTVIAIRRQLAKRPATDTGALAVNARSRRLQRIAWAFMLPGVLSVIVWAYYPLARGLVMAFQDYKVIQGAHFIGLDNFIDVFTSETVWRGLENAALFTVYSIVIGFFLPIVLAILLSEVPRGTSLFRTLYYLPAVTSGLVIIFLWKWFEDPTPTGLFNTLLGAIHLAPVNWLGDPKIALLSVVLPGAWAGAGPGSIIYLAALKSIPTDMYEAADLDGAGVWTKLTRLTLPTLKPLILINLVGATVGSFKAMETIFIMTGGGPLLATHTIGLEIWYNAFLYLRFGFATAAAWVMGSLLVGFTLFQLRMMRNMRFSAST
ncbi:MAG TPA: extracellular solute-binding protein [Capsulimonadaceae bacterium]|jgi:multiple sugar transport system permease protein